MQIRHTRRSDEAWHSTHFPVVPSEAEGPVHAAAVNDEGIRALARGRGDTRVIWTTGEENKGSQRFYDRLGMRREKKVYFVIDT